MPNEREAKASLSSSYRQRFVHGSIVLRCLAMDDGEIDEGCDWATGEALNDQADLFIWDGDGMGAGLNFLSP